MRACSNFLKTIGLFYSVSLMTVIKYTKLCILPMQIVICMQMKRILYQALHKSFSPHSLQIFGVTGYWKFKKVLSVRRNFLCLQRLNDESENRYQTEWQVVYRVSRFQRWSQFKMPSMELSYTVAYRGRTRTIHYAQICSFQKNRF